MRDGYAERVWGMYGSGDQAGELYDSGDRDFGGECGDDEGPGDGHGGVVLAVVVAAAVACSSHTIQRPVISTEAVTVSS